MTPKEVMYVEDALAHAQFMQQQCCEAVSKLQDESLKQQAQQLMDKNQETFRRLYSLV